MNNDLLSQLLGSLDATANAPVEEPAMSYGQEFFAMSPAARLETLKLQQAGGGLDPTGQALMGLLSRRVARESGQPLTSAMSPANPAPSSPSMMERIQQMDPLAPLRTQQYSR